MDTDTNIRQVSITRLSTSTRLSTRLSQNETSSIDDQVSSEILLTVYVNNQELVTIATSPSDIDRLVAGVLLGDGIIRRLSDIQEFRHDKLDNIVYVTTSVSDTAITAMTHAAKSRPGLRLSGCGKGVTNYMKKLAGLNPPGRGLAVDAAEIFRQVKAVAGMSVEHHATGGTHSAALISSGRICCFFEDISRHNAVDKIAGERLFSSHDMANDRADDWIVTSGRISSDLVYKMAVMGIGLVASRNAPTTLAVEAAGLLDITLAGFVRGKRMNIYTAPFRINC